MPPPVAAAQSRRSDQFAVTTRDGTLIVRESTSYPTPRAKTLAYVPGMIPLIVYVPFAAVVAW